MTVPDDVKQWRKARRAELIGTRTSVSKSQRRAWDATLTQRLLEGFPQLEHATVGFCWPFNGEFDPRFAIHHWRDRGARAALPVVVEKSAPLQFREWWPGAPMTTGVYALPVPDGTAIVVPHALLIPPVGFDGQGFRLGYGGGYFDRTLAAMTPQPLKIGVAYEVSRMETIRPQPHDVPMDFIVTEAGVYHAGTAGLVFLDDPALASAMAAAVLQARANENRHGQARGLEAG